MKNGTEISQSICTQVFIHIYVEFQIEFSFILDFCRTCLFIYLFSSGSKYGWLGLKQNRLVQNNPSDPHCGCMASLQLFFHFLVLITSENKMASSESAVIKREEEGVV